MAAGSEDPIRRCFDASYRRLVGQLYAVCGDLTEAEEVVAEAFARAVASRRSFERLERPEAWLRTVAVNVARTRHRRSAVGERLLGRRAEPAARREVELTDDRMALVTGDHGADGIALRAADAAEVPDFDGIARRGRVRRTRRRVGALGVVAATVVGVVGVTQLAGGGTPDRRPSQIDVPPTELPSPTAGDDGDGVTPRGLAGTVDAADASVLDLAVVPGKSERMATLWQEPDDEQHWVLAVTGDAWETRQLLQVPWGSDVVPGPDGWFVLREGWSGEIRHLDADGGGDAFGPVGADAPMVDGEVMVQTGEPGSLRLVAVATDGSAHQVPLPDGVQQLESYGGRLTAFAGLDGAIEMHWSDDGGASWGRRRFEGSFLAGFVSSAAGQDLAMIEGGDGATLFPLDAVNRAANDAPDAWTRAEIDVPDSHVTTTAAWLQDGELRVLATRWNDDERTGWEAGVWRVDGSTIRKVASDHPEITGGADLPMLLVTFDGGPDLWVHGATGEAWRSRDGGEHWQRYALR